MPNDDDIIELSDDVAQEIERRVEKRDELIQDANEKGEAFDEAREKAEDQIDSNKNYMKAVADVNGVDIEDYLYDEKLGALRRETPPKDPKASPKERPKTTDMGANEAVLYIREHGADAVEVPEDENRVLIMEALNES